MTDVDLVGRMQNMPRFATVFGKYLKNWKHLDKIMYGQFEAYKILYKFVLNTFDLYHIVLTVCPTKFVLC